jgi:hypothetical protein
MGRRSTTNGGSWSPQRSGMAGKSSPSSAIRGSAGRTDERSVQALAGYALLSLGANVTSWSVDRLGRSLRHLVGFLGELHAKKVDLYLHQQGVDTSTPAGKALFQMMGVFAEFESAIIVERINAGLARAKANGVVLGRPRSANRSRTVPGGSSRRALVSLRRPSSLASEQALFSASNGRWRYATAEQERDEGLNLEL